MEAKRKRKKYKRLICFRWEDREDDYGWTLVSALSIQRSRTPGGWSPFLNFGLISVAEIKRYSLLWGEGNFGVSSLEWHFLHFFPITFSLKIYLFLSCAKIYFRLQSCSPVNKANFSTSATQLRKKRFAFKKTFWLLDWNNQLQAQVNGKSIMLP